MTNKDKVYQSYEKIADWFDSVRMQDLSFEKPYLDIVTTHIKPNGKILDLGCGTGLPIAQYFVDAGFQVTGVDGSHNMIEKAKRYVSKAKFYVQDMRHLCLEEKFDAIVLWHSLFHLPADDQRLMFAVLEKHINPAGILLFTSGHEAGEVWSDNGGENLYHASFSTSEYKELLEKYNFEVITHTIEDANCGDATVWVAKYHR